jgi:hypothetical protein
VILGPDFPHLTPDNHHITSPPTTVYNCIAWAAGDTTRWWQPGRYWPVPATDYGIGVLEAAFLKLGFEVCDSDGVEVGFEKVALYAESGFLYTHAARQLPDGRWTSKLGRGEDIEHDTPDVLAGGIYGEVVQFVRRAIPGSSPAESA